MEQLSAKGLDQKFCHECGGAISAKAEICPKCGVRQPHVVGMLAQGGHEAKSKTMAVVLALLLGGIGIHKFYLGKPVWGVVYLLFCWTFIPAIVAFIEGLNYAFMSESTFAARYGSD